MFERIVEFVQSRFPGQRQIVLHEPRFDDAEKRYVTDTISSTFVSSVGAYVGKFEEGLARVLEVPPEHVVAVVNGTNALQVALRLAGVERGDLVLTQSLTFIATCNAVKYLDADPAFIDVDEETMGMSASRLQEFLKTECLRQTTGQVIHRASGKRVAAVVPMHTFGHPTKMDEIAAICQSYGIQLVEDAAESLGTTFKSKPMGTFGDLGVFSFNGNKIITTGGGGAIYAKSIETARRAKHLTTTAKVPHPWAFVHDEVGYNFRMPNLNAALGCAQLEKLGKFLEQKRALALAYSGFFEGMDGVKFVTEPAGAKSNYWLNTILFDSEVERDEFLKFAHSKNVQCRPVWEPMHRLKLYRDCIRQDLTVTESLAARAVNLPSSANEVVK